MRALSCKHGAVLDAFNARHALPYIHENYKPDPERLRYLLNVRGRPMFFKRAEEYFREGPFITKNWIMDERGVETVETYKFESKENGHIFKLVGSDNHFYLLQVNRLNDNMWGECWYTPVIRNYFCFLAFVSKECAVDSRAPELVSFDC